MGVMLAPTKAQQNRLSLRVDDETEYEVGVYGAAPVEVRSDRDVVHVENPLAG